MVIDHETGIVAGTGSLRPCHQGVGMVLHRVQIPSAVGSHDGPHEKYGLASPQHEAVMRRRRKNNSGGLYFTFHRQLYYEAIQQAIADIEGQFHQPDFSSFSFFDH